MGALSAFLNRNIGRCPRCMKTAFAAAAGAWALFAVARGLWPNLPAAALTPPLALTGLWLAHVTAYSYRIVGLLWREYRPSTSPGQPAPDAVALSRRSLISLSSLALGVIATGTVWLPMRAAAAGNPCGEGYTCPDDAPNCCSRSRHKCCNGNWACAATGTCYSSHADARAGCGSGQVWACS